MDEEELEQPKKITIGNFFESIQKVDKVANRALKKTGSNLLIINKNKSLIDGFKKSVKEINEEIKEIKKYIEDTQEDKLFSQEDQEQKIKRLERLQGIDGKEIDPTESAAGTTDDSDFEKQAADTFKKALKNPNIMSILTGLIGMSVAGFLGAGAEGVKDVKERKFSEKTGGVLDALTLNLTDFDKKGGKPVGAMETATGIIDFFTANMFDLDKRGGLFESKESFEKRQKIDEKIKEEKKNRPKKGLMRLLPFNLGGEVKDNDNDTSNNNEDSVPAILTPGEFVVTKDAVDKIGVDALKGLNASVGDTSKPELSSLEIGFGGGDMSLFEKKQTSVGGLDSSFMIDGEKQYLTPSQIKKQLTKMNVPYKELLNGMVIPDAAKMAADKMPEYYDKTRKIISETVKDEKMREKMLNELEKFMTNLAGGGDFKDTSQIEAEMNRYIPGTLENLGLQIGDSAKKDYLAQKFNQGGLVEGAKKMYSSEIEENKSKNNLKPLLDMIGSGESDNVGGYSAMFPSESYPKMLDMTINEVIEFQKEKLKDGRKSVAVGRYQMLYPEDYAAAAGLPLTAKFTPKNQDKMVISYLKKNRKLNEFLQGKITNEQFSEELAEEFGTFKSASGFVLPNNTGSIDFPKMMPVFNEIKNELKPNAKSSDNLQSVIESKSNDLDQSILTPPSVQNKVNLLPIPVNQSQPQPVNGNVPVAAPQNSPQVTTTPVASTMSSVSFINMISNKQLSIG